MEWLERRDVRNQARIEEANRAYARDPGGDRTPGPPWAHALGAVPFLHLIGDAAIAIDAWRRRKREP